jgi:hypothetical protein
MPTKTGRVQAPKNPHRITLTPRVLLLVLAYRSERLDSAQLAAAIGLQEGDVFAFLERVREASRDAARAVTWE